MSDSCSTPFLSDAHKEADAHILPPVDGMKELNSEHSDGLEVFRWVETKKHGKVGDVRRTAGLGAG